jgi:hypothetical protein
VEELGDSITPIKDLTEVLAVVAVENRDQVAAALSVETELQDRETMVVKVKMPLAEVRRSAVVVEEPVEWAKMP